VPVVEDGAASSWLLFALLFDFFFLLAPLLGWEPPNPPRASNAFKVVTGMLLVCLLFKIIFYFVFLFDQNLIYV
jgi:hypothetical protein